MSGEATLPIPQPAIKADISKLVAFAKGFPDSCNANLWPADPEEACTRHALFLGVWFKHGALSKPVERQAMKEANHKLTTSECKLIVNQIHECKNFLRRKWKNLKTGEKTSGLLMGLMQSLFGTPQPAERPVRRLNQKTPKKKALQPAEEKPEQGPAPITFLESPAAILPSDQEVVEIESTAASTAVSQQDLEPAKRPSCKKVPKKVPACKRPSAASKAKACWKKSLSFGFVKETKASNKAYIVSKPEEGSKPTCLVNVQLPRGPDQDRVMSALMAKACEEASLEKKQLVSYKDQLLKDSPAQPA